VTPPTQQTPDGESHLPGQVVGLIEASSQEPHGMERHRHHRVRALERFETAAAHQASEGLSQLTASFEFERVYQLPKRTFVTGGTSRHGECR
jgi:hypothetical protein